MAPVESALESGPAARRPTERDDMAALAPSKEELLSSEALRWIEITSPTLTELRSFDEEAIKKQIQDSFNYFSSHQQIANGNVWEKHIEREFIAVAQRWETNASGWGEEWGLILHAKAQAWQKLRMLRTPLEQVPHHDIRVICELRGQVVPPPSRSNFKPEQLPQYMESLAAYFGSCAISQARQSNGMLGINRGRPADIRAAISADGMIDVSSIYANARERARREKEAIPLPSGDTSPASKGLDDPTEAVPASGYVGMMDKLARRPTVSDIGYRDEAGRQEQFRRRWQVPKITELADYRDFGDGASLDRNGSRASDVVVSPASPSSNPESSDETERAAPSNPLGNVLWFPTERGPSAQINSEGDSFDCEGKSAPPDRIASPKRALIRDLLSPGDLRVYEIQQACGLSFKDKKALQAEIEQKNGIGVSSANKDLKWTEAIRAAIKRCAYLQRVLAVADRLYPAGFAIPFDADAESSVRAKLVASNLLPKGAIDLFLLRLRILLHREAD
jgi:hypothetical protein